MGTVSIARSVTASAPVGRLDGLPESARVGDHAEIKQFLAALFQQPSPQEFQAQLDDPFYEPSDRLLVRRDGRLGGHVLLSWRTMCFGNSKWPVCRASYLGVLPEFGRHDVPRQLILATQRQIAEVGTAIGELDACARFVENCDWAACGRHVFTQASPRDILAELTARQASEERGILAVARREPIQRLSVRLWRHVELPALMRIYEANLETAYGALERSETYWRWLIGRRAFDQIFIAIEGRDKLSLEEDGCRIVGYAVTRDRNILELMTEPGHPTAAARLLSRACADAIEHDRHVVRLHAPPDYSLHEVIRAAGGSYHHYETDRNMVALCKLTNPADFAAGLGDQWRNRVEAAGLELPIELGIHVDRKKWQLNVSPRGVKLNADKLGRSYITCDADTLTRLLLGYDDSLSAADAGRLVFSTGLAADAAHALFPKIPMWRPPWDNLSA